MTLFSTDRRKSRSPQMHSPLERYLSIGITESLHRHQFHLACTDLTFILRHAYSKLPKNVQSLIFHDTLSAFGLLPRMQAQNAISVANLLHQSVDAVLPKHKRILALSEFKQAKVAYKRRSKYRLEGEVAPQLPQDVVMHIFSFLDVQVLLSSALVCRSWNLAASEGYLWQSHYLSFFGNSDNSPITRSPDCDGINWKEAFKRKYAGSTSKKFTYRGYCEHCETLVLLKNMECPYKNPEQNSQKHQIIPMSPHQIAEYVLHIHPWNVDSCYDSDSDSDDEACMSKLWVYPGHLKTDSQRDLKPALQKQESGDLKFASQRDLRVSFFLAHILAKQESKASPPLNKPSISTPGAALLRSQQTTIAYFQSELQEHQI